MESRIGLSLGKDLYGMNAKIGFDTSLFELDTLTGLPPCVNENIEVSIVS